MTPIERHLLRAMATILMHHGRGTEQLELERAITLFDQETQNTATVRIHRLADAMDNLEALQKGEHVTP